jgi:hypothetical protein
MLLMLVMSLTVPKLDVDKPPMIALCALVYKLNVSIKQASDQLMPRTGLNNLTELDPK